MREGYNAILAYARADSRIDVHFERIRERCRQAVLQMTEHEHEARKYIEFKLQFGRWPDRIQFKATAPVLVKFPLAPRKPQPHPKFSQTCICGEVFKHANGNVVTERWHQHLLDKGCKWPWPIPEVDRARKAREEIKEILSLIFGGVR